MGRSVEMSNDFQQERQRKIDIPFGNTVLSVPDITGKLIATLHGDDPEEIVSTSEHPMSLDEISTMVYGEYNNQNRKKLLILRGSAQQYLVPVGYQISSRRKYREEITDLFLEELKVTQPSLSLIDNSVLAHGVEERVEAVFHTKYGDITPADEYTLLEKAYKIALSLNGVDINIDSVLEEVVRKNSNSISPLKARIIKRSLKPSLESMLQRIKSQQQEEK